jgi:hypothetical protein
MHKLNCKECGYQNEPERVYCHNCGVKLDRSMLPREAEKTERNQLRKRVKKMTNPKSGFFAGFWRTLISTVIWAALVAALIQIVRPPENVPKMPESTFVDAPPISMILENLVRKGGGQSLRLDDESVNNYLFGVVRAKGNDVLGEYLKYDRSFVRTRDGVIEISVQYSIYGFPIYVTTFYKLGIDEQGGSLLAENCGGRFGSLPVHPFLMPYLEYPITKLWSATGREKRAMDKLGDIRIDKGGLVVTAPQQPGE